MNVSGGAQRLLSNIGSLESKGIDTKGLSSRIEKPIVFNAGRGVAHGYEATVLVDICNVILAARKAVDSCDEVRYSSPHALG